MEKPFIKYKSGYKYQLVEEYAADINIAPENDVHTDFIELDVEGTLVIKKGYAWDGPSGPTIDTSNFMRGSLVHDALYQLMRNGFIDREFRDAADEELKRICLEDGMTRLRAWLVYSGVRFGGGPAASPESLKEIYKAPKG